jgi:glycosyltransferase involved in cell wall biosynthesis
MACGTPVVATSSAAAGLDVVAGRDLLVADDAQTFADAVSRLLGDRVLGERLARNARVLVERRYTWKGSALAIERHWQVAATGIAGNGEK